MRKDRLFFRHTQLFATQRLADPGEDIDAVRARCARGAAIFDQVMQMRQCLTDGEEHLVLIKFPREQLLEHINAGAGAADRIGGLVQALVVMLGEVGESRMQPAKRPIMAWQNQRL